MTIIKAIRVGRPKWIGRKSYCVTSLKNLINLTVGLLVGQIVDFFRVRVAEMPSLSAKS